MSGFVSLASRLALAPGAWILFALFAIELALLGYFIPGYLDLAGLLDASRGLVEMGIIALGMTFIIIMGGLDISVGSLLALVTVAIGFSYQAGLPLPLAIVLGVMVGCVGGIVNGLLVTGLRLNSFVVTLATMALFRGIALAATDGAVFSNFPEWFYEPAQASIGPVPVQLIIFVVLAVILAFVLSRTAFGRRVYAIGSNEEASIFSGVDVVKTKIIVYALQGFLVGIAGLIYASRVSSARGDAGIGVEFSVITIVVFGGCRITGGSGSILGTVGGALIIWYLQDGLSYAGVTSDVGLVASGLFLIVGLLVNLHFSEIRKLLLRPWSNARNPNPKSAMPKEESA